MKNQRLRDEKSKQQVKIGTEEYGYATMIIITREENGLKLFHLMESELTLQMKKVLY